jgi:DNA-binding HxlR family transcriptional regulator
MALESLNVYESSPISTANLVLRIIGGKWKLQILFNLMFFERNSFGSLRKDLERISEKMLSQQLMELQRHKLIEKKILSVKPYRVEYSLTEDGKSITPLCQSMSDWGKKYLEKQETKIQSNHG